MLKLSVDFQSQSYEILVRSQLSQLQAFSNQKFIQSLLNLNGPDMHHSCGQIAFESISFRSGASLSQAPKGKTDRRSLIHFFFSRTPQTGDTLIGCAARQIVLNKYLIRAR